MALKGFEKQSNPTIPAEWLKNKWQGKSVDFRIAQKEDIPALARLYTVCFGDDTTEAEQFLHTFFHNPDFHLLLAARKEAVISMLAMIPARLAKGENAFYRGFYLYGIGTLPSFRKQGLSGSLMDLAKTLASSLNYDFLFLVPASESLISFYKKQGFFTAYPTKSKKPSCYFPGLTGQTTTPSDFATPMATFPNFSSLTAISLEEYLALRSNLEKEAGVFSLLEPFQSYALEMIQEHLHFYKETQSIQEAAADSDKREYGICFYRGSKLEQTGPSSILSGGLTHQIFPLHSFTLPSSTYFQFPMDELSSFIY